MVKIYLASTPGASSYIIGNQNIEKQDFPISNLFFRYQHNRTGWLSNDNIQVYEKYSWSGSFVTLKATGVYDGYSVKHEHVYFNKYNEGVPLVLVIFFTGRGNVKNKFYRLAGFKQDLGNTKDIEELEDYTTDENMLTALLEENDKIETILTYNIGLTEGTGEDKDTYNGQKIKLTKLTSNPEDDEDQKSLLKAFEGDVFRIYTHKSLNLRSPNKYCYIYKQQLLIDEKKQPIRNLINNNYILTVYFSVVNKPLIIEFSKQGSDKKSNLYYYLKESDDGTEYWEQIKQGSVLDVEITDDKIYEQLTSNDYEKLLSLLRTLNNKCTKTIFFMLDAQKDPYGKSEIGLAFDEYSNYKMINNDEITVEEKKDDNVKCITDKKFIVIEHDFSQIASSIENNEVAELKFIIPNAKDKHSIVTLYKDDKAKEIDSLMYSKGKKRLYTYFYGHDFRTLILCYNGQAYKPKDLNEYQFKWVKDNSIGSCCCDGSTTGLINTLTNVTSFLNVVNLNERPDPGSENKTYDIYKLGDKQIQIRVKVGEPVGCYKVYVHEPNEEGYRLGNIEYKEGFDEIKGSISYESNWNSYGYLGRVFVYYYNLDEEYRYPLIVVLEFKNNFKSIFKQYQLSSINYKWSQTYGFEYNENKLLQDLYILTKRFNLKDYKDHESECLGKNKHIGAIIGTVVPTTLVTGGIAVAFYLNPNVFFYIYRWLI
nr:hypothetical protein MACL_00001668 [Theileria orientalis]